MFIAHGFYVISNACSYEVQLSDDGDAARLKAGDEITEWFEIEYCLNENDHDELIPIIDPDGYHVELNLVIRY